MSIWTLKENAEEYLLLKELIERFHMYLQESKIVLYASDKNKLKANQVVVAESGKAPMKLKAAIDADFTIMFYPYWTNLNAKEKLACLDHQLKRCSVHYEPYKEQVGTSRGGKPKLSVVRDEFGRKQYTNEIKRDEFGKPKWRLLPYEVEEYHEVVLRHGAWNEILDEFRNALDTNEERN